ncbi:MAG: hypothetical protein CBC04_02665 [Verrucomicrobia bacterium TMED44]|nr:MAG: hypothetical protein CBC04_02665 [Verrucomicrobia bacterium TMED44]
MNRFTGQEVGTPQLVTAGRIDIPGIFSKNIRWFVLLFVKGIYSLEKYPRMGMVIVLGELYLKLPWRYTNWN